MGLDGRVIIDCRQSKSTFGANNLIFGLWQLHICVCFSPLIIVSNCLRHHIVAFQLLGSCPFFLSFIFFFCLSLSFSRPNFWCQGSAWSLQCSRSTSATASSSSPTSNSTSRKPARSNLNYLRQISLTLHSIYAKISVSFHIDCQGKPGLQWHCVRQHQQLYENPKGISEADCSSSGGFCYQFWQILGLLKNSNLDL